MVYYASRKRVQTDSASVPILAYHEICNLPRKIARMHSYNVNPSSFKDQMKFLYENKYSVIKLEELISCLIEKKELSRKAVVITFDDGYKNNYVNAFPVLKQYGYPATIFLATDYIGAGKVFPWLNDLLAYGRMKNENWMPLSWQEVEEMSRWGITFGSHTCSHTNIRMMTERNFEKEIEASKNIIEKKISRQVELFSYPFSFPKYGKRHRHLTEKTRAILFRKGFLGACTTIIGTNDSYSERFCLKRIQIRATDDPFQLEAKIAGAYNWGGITQKIYQQFLEPLTQMRHIIKALLRSVDYADQSRSMISDIGDENSKHLRRSLTDKDA